MSTVREIPVNSELDVIRSRIKLRQIASEYGLSLLSQASISLALSSLASLMNLGIKVKGNILVDKVNGDLGCSGIKAVLTVNELENDTLIMSTIRNSQLKYLVEDFSMDNSSQGDLIITLVKWDQ